MRFWETCTLRFPSRSLPICQFHGACMHNGKSECAKCKKSYKKPIFLQMSRFLEGLKVKLFHSRESPTTRRSGAVELEVRVTGSLGPLSRDSGTESQEVTTRFYVLALDTMIGFLSLWNSSDWSNKPMIPRQWVLEYFQGAPALTLEVKWLLA